MCRPIFFFCAVFLIFSKGIASDALTPATEQLRELEALSGPKTLNMDFPAFRNVLERNITATHDELRKFKGHSTWPHRHGKMHIASIDANT